MRLRVHQRLRRNADFRAAREQGRRADCGAFLLTWRLRDENPDAPARVGVVASRAAIGNAVMRNAAKRRLREVYRANQDRVPAGLDLVLTARPALLRLSFAEVSERFHQACRKFSAAAR